MSYSNLYPLECHRYINKLYRELRGKSIGKLGNRQIRRQWVKIVESLGSETVIREAEKWIRSETSKKWARYEKDAIKSLVRHLSKLIADGEEAETFNPTKSQTRTGRNLVANQSHFSRNLVANQSHFSRNLVAPESPLVSPYSLENIHRGSISASNPRGLGGGEKRLINQGAAEKPADTGTGSQAAVAGGDSSREWAGSAESEGFNPAKVYEEIFRIWAKRVGSPFGPVSLAKFPKTSEAWCDLVRRHGKKKILRALGFWLEDNESRLSDPRYKYPVSVFVFEAENYIAASEAYYAAHTYSEYVDVDGVKVPKCVEENFRRSKREMDELYERKKREKYEREVWQVWQGEIRRRHGIAWDPELTPENQKELDDCYAVAERVIQKLWERRGLVWNPPSDDWWHEVEKIRAEIDAEAKAEVKVE